MKILFDFRSYQISAYRGIGRYFLSLYEHMVNIGGFDAYVLVSKNYDLTLPQSVISTANILLLENFDDYEIDGDFDFLFKGNFFDLHDNSFEFTFPKNVILKCRQVVGIIHDLIPMIFPDNYLQNQGSREVYARHVECLHLANYLFANSVCTKNDCVKLADYPKQNISVIYGGADNKKFYSANSDKPYSAKKRKNHIVFVPGEDLRKNFTGAARAFAKAYESGKLPKNAKLYLVCKASPWFEEQVLNAIKDSKAKLGEQIIVTGFVEDNVLLDLLASARASIFPSFYEGLGLPILESYIAGTPCFASDLSATKEFVLPECSFNPYNEEELVQSIISIYTNEELCKKSLDFGRKLVKKINWDNAALTVVKKLTELQQTDNKKKKVAVFSTLPPDKSGIAQYSYKTHTIHHEHFDIIADINDIDRYNDLLNSEEIYRFYGRNIQYHLRDNVSFKDHSIVFNNFSNKEIATYGPYVALRKGSYDLKIEYNLDANCTCEFRVVSDFGNNLCYIGQLDYKKSEIIAGFELSEDKENIEVQTLFQGKGFLTIKSISFIKHKKLSDYKETPNIIPMCSYPFMHLFRDYIGKIFVLGNSEHHQCSLTEAMRTKGEPNRLLYMHEAFIIFAFYPMLGWNLDRIKNFLLMWYPYLQKDLENVRNIGDFYDILRHNHVCGIKPLLNLTQIKHIAVNNQRAKELVEAELTDFERSEVKIDVLYHPIPDLRRVKPLTLESKQNGYTVIGSFGMADKSKSTDVLITAVDELNRRGYKIKLLLAGYNIKAYVQEHNVDCRNLIIENAPNGEELLALMKSVDLAVQLRKDSHGESSGSIAELLGLNQKFITTEGFINADFLPYCTTVPADVTIEELKQAILRSLKEPVKPNKLYKKYTYEHLASKLYELAVKG